MILRVVGSCVSLLLVRVHPSSAVLPRWWGQRPLGKSKQAWSVTTALVRCALLATNQSLLVVMKEASMP